MSAVMYEVERSAGHWGHLDTQHGRDALALVTPMAKAAARRATLPADDVAQVARLVLAQTLASGLVGTMAAGAAVKRAVSALARDAGREAVTLTPTGAEVTAEAAGTVHGPADSLARPATPNGARVAAGTLHDTLAQVIPLAKGAMDTRQRAILRALAWHDGWQSGRVPTGAIARDVEGANLQGRRLVAFGAEVATVRGIVAQVAANVLTWEQGRTMAGHYRQHAATPYAEGCTYAAPLTAADDGPRQAGTLDAGHKWTGGHSAREAASLAIAESTLTVRSLRPVAGVTPGLVTGAGQRAGDGKVPAVKRSRRPGRVGSTGPTVPASGH